MLSIPSEIDPHLLIRLLQLAVACALALTCGCAGQEPADLVLLGGKIHTVDPATPRAQAVALRGNRIAAVGTDNEIAEYIQPGRTQVIELGGKLVLPGFNDAHLHFIKYGGVLDGLNLTGITSYGQMREMLAAKVASSSPGEWIHGSGWDHVIIPDRQWPTREIIDSVSPVNPVVLTRIDGHSVLVNSRVLELSGIDSSTPDPPGGTIVHDTATGQPTGVLKEKARALIHEPELSEEQTYELSLKYLRLALESAAELGVTSIQPMAASRDFSPDLQAYEELERNGELTVRVYSGRVLTDDPAALAQYAAERARLDSNPLIKFGTLKGFVDGTIGSQTAALFEPFSDDSTKTGLLMMPEEELETKVLAADRAGFQVSLHAIGTRGNNLALGVFEKARQVNGVRDSRHRVEHVSLLIPRDIPRFAELGVIASVQPTFCVDQQFTEQRFGLERCRWAFAWRSILDSGGKIAFGTDCPVEILDPMAGLYVAVTRRERRGDGSRSWFPEEKLTMEEAVRLYTMGSAYASFEEHTKGSISPGKLADMVVLSRDLFSIPEDEIMNTRVLYTIFDGKVIYRKQD